MPSGGGRPAGRDDHKSIPSHVDASIWPRQWRQSVKPRPNCRSTFTRTSCWVCGPIDDFCNHALHMFLFRKQCPHMPRPHRTHSHSARNNSFFRLADFAQENSREMARCSSNCALQAGRCPSTAARCRRGHFHLLQHMYVIRCLPSQQEPFSAAAFQCVFSC